MEEKEFKPITSQAELDAVLKDRLNRQSEKHSKEIEALKAEYEGFDAMKSAQVEHEKQIDELKKQLEEAQAKSSGYESQIAERDQKIKEFELYQLKASIAKDADLSPDAIEFLQGDDEETLRASAERLSKIAPKHSAPLAKNEGPVGDERTEALRTMLQDLKLGGK